MGFKFVFLWTDVALWALFVVLLVYSWRIHRQPNLRALWLKVLRDPAGLCAGVVLLMFLGVTALDGVHFRRALPAVPGAGESVRVFYDTRTESVLDLLLARQYEMTETTYSRPLAYVAFSKETVVVGGKDVREFPRLKYGGSHLKNPQQEWLRDVLSRCAVGAALGLAISALVGLALAWALRKGHGGLQSALRDIAADRTHYPVRAVVLTLFITGLLCGPVAMLMNHYHVLGTDRTGNDVLIQVFKSVRTAFVIGSLATLAMLPLAVVLGILAGYFKGWVDDLIQYIYTTVASVPGILLIAACVLMIQVFLDKHPELFETGVERADLKIFWLCVILGLTGWASLCRLVRGETLKLRELEYVQAAVALGVGHARIMGRHILPNVTYLVLITTVLSFSDLILFEAVLTYVGVGVDPSMNSFGGMINMARNEMSRDPVVWWSFAAAFVAMVTLVLAANLFADAVRDAFDPRARSLRPRVLAKA